MFREFNSDCVDMFSKFLNKNTIVQFYKQGSPKTLHGLLRDARQSTQNGEILWHLQFPTGNETIMESRLISINIEQYPFSFDSPTISVVSHTDTRPRGMYLTLGTEDTGILTKKELIMKVKVQTLIDAVQRTLAIKEAKYAEAFAKNLADYKAAVDKFLSAIVVDKCSISPHFVIVLNNLTKIKTDLRTLQALSDDELEVNLKGVSFIDNIFIKYIVENGS